MAEYTHISWADHTFNPWIGCMKVGPACDGCYAEALMSTTGRMKRVEWGAPGQGVGTRSRTSASNWKQPLKWNREAAAAVEAWRTNPFARPETPKPSRFVFCASLADVFDNAVPNEWRLDLFDLIRKTPHLTWLLLTKRPQNIVKLFSQATGAEQFGHPPFSSFWPRNAAVGCTVVTQGEADRDVPHLLAAKAALNPAFAFLSMEPLLGPVDLTRINVRGATLLDALRGWHGQGRDRGVAIDWVITGGETDQGSHKARPSHPDWFRSLRNQCAAAGVAYHHKQNGEWLHRPEILSAGGPGVHRFDDGAWMDRIGKKAAGRTLDGVIHDARPEAA